jgi:putative YhdH/YhfP family quinone oxidoreductase
VVTGASGGVGSLAVAILGKLGYDVTAVSGKTEAREFLEKLGAKRIVGREEVDDRTPKPLLSARWAGAVDTVGGNTLATLLRGAKNGACITACGLVGGAELPMTVFPFILRGVTLAGIDSAWCPREKRERIWSLLGTNWKLSGLDALAKEIDWTGLDHEVQEILAARVMGRILVRPV